MILLNISQEIEFRLSFLHKIAIFQRWKTRSSPPISKEDIVSDCGLIGRDLPDKKYDTFSTIVNNNIFLVIPKFA